MAEPFDPTDPLSAPTPQPIEMEVVSTDAAAKRYAMDPEVAADYLKRGLVRQVTQEELDRERELDAADSGVQAWRAGAENFARGLTGGMSDRALVALGADKEGIALRQEANAGEAGQIAGGVLGGVTLGVGAAVGAAALAGAGAAGAGLFSAVTAAEAAVDFAAGASAQVNQDWLHDAETSTERAVIAGLQDAALGFGLGAAVRGAKQAVKSTGEALTKVAGKQTVGQATADAALGGFEKAEKEAAQKLAGGSDELGDRLHRMGIISGTADDNAKGAAPALARAEQKMAEVGKDLEVNYERLDIAAESTPGGGLDGRGLIDGVDEVVANLGKIDPVMAEAVRKKFAPMLDRIVDRTGPKNEAMGLLGEDWANVGITGDMRKLVQNRMDKLAAAEPGTVSPKDFLEREVRPLLQGKNKHLSESLNQSNLKEFDAFVSRVAAVEGAAVKKVSFKEAWEFRKEFDAVSKLMDKTTQSPAIAQVLAGRAAFSKSLADQANKLDPSIGNAISESSKDYIALHVAQTGLEKQVQRISRMSGGSLGVNAASGGAIGALSGGVAFGNPLTGAALGMGGALSSALSPRVADAARHWAPTIREAVAQLAGPGKSPALQASLGNLSVLTAPARGSRIAAVAAYRSSQIEERRKEIQADIDPQGVRAIQVSMSDPDHGGSIEAKRQQVGQYLLDNMPKAGNQQTAFGFVKPPQYDPKDLKKYAEVERAVLDPGAVLQRIAAGTVKDHEIKALNEVYPKLFDRVRVEALRRAASTMTPPTPQEVRVLRSIIGVLPGEARLGSWAQQVAEAAQLTPPVEPLTPGGVRSPSRNKMDGYGNVAVASDRLQGPLGGG